MITVQKRQLTVEMVILTRGVEDVLFISMDGVSGLEEGAKAIFKDVVVQRCIVHLIRNSIKYIPSKDYKKIHTIAEKRYTEQQVLQPAEKAFELKEAFSQTKSPCLNCFI